MRDGIEGAALPSTTAKSHNSQSETEARRDGGRQSRAIEYIEINEKKVNEYFRSKLRFLPAFSVPFAPSAAAAASANGRASAETAAATFRALAEPTEKQTEPEKHF